MQRTNHIRHDGDACLDIHVRFCFREHVTHVCACSCFLISHFSCFPFPVSSYLFLRGYFADCQRKQIFEGRGLYWLTSKLIVDHGSSSWAFWQPYFSIVWPLQLQLSRSLLWNLIFRIGKTRPGSLDLGLGCGFSRKVSSCLA